LKENLGSGDESFEDSCRIWVPLHEKKTDEEIRTGLDMCN
jgi:hypothetical protein